MPRYRKVKCSVTHTPRLGQSNDAGRVYQYWLREVVSRTVGASSPTLGEKAENDWAPHIEMVALVPR